MLSPQFSIQPLAFSLSLVWCLIAAAAFALLAPANATGTALDYAREILRDKPVAWWRFQDERAAEGVTARDSAAKHDGIYRGGVTLEPGPAKIGGKAVRFDGRSGLVSITDHRDFASERISVEFWLKSAQSWDRLQWPGSATLVTKATEGDGSGDWTINAGSRQMGINQGLLIASSGPRGGHDQSVYSQPALNDGRWHHVVWTRSAEGSIELYLDGALIDQGGDSGGTIINSRAIQIGGDRAPNGSFLDGCMAEVCIYTNVLAPARVAAHFAAGATIDARLGVAPVAKPLETMTLKSGSGLRWELQRFPAGWTLGGLKLRGKYAAPALTRGVIMLRHCVTGEERWLAASECKITKGRTAVLGGQSLVGEALFRFQVELSLADSLPVVTLTPSWSVDKGLDGWEVCLAWHGKDPNAWRCTLYPFAGNAPRLARQKLTYCGIPSALLFRPDLSLVTLFGIAPDFDYLNPTTWTGDTGFHFSDGVTPPQFRVGGGKLKAGVDYRLPLQLFLNDAGNSANAITALVKNWIKVNRYQVEPLKVRSRQEGFDLFIQGRKQGRMWHEGLGYQIMENWKVIYTAESPLNAWFDYLLYEQTGDAAWRKRAFDALDFMLKAQHTDPADPFFGAIDTNFDLDKKVFNSDDHTSNWRYKVDMNSFAARYLLQVWQRVKQKEGVDHREWYQAAVRIADWVMKQQNPDGGLPQVVDNDPAKKSISVVSGRSLAAFPVIHRITGDARYGRFAGQLEQFLRTQVEDRFWFAGAHVDLWPKDFEADSVWHAVEYWLNKYDETKDRECLKHAEADAWFAFLMWCPKQLAWVKNPTQTCHTEQENYLQYSNYCYNNRKYYCLDRLAQLTGQPLFSELCERVIQCGFWAQPTAGDWIGGVNERMSDPWLALSKDFNSTAQVYTGELATDAALQLLEMGFGKP